MRYRKRKLTHKQYREILQMIKKTVDKPGFKPDCYNSTFTGDKYTESNCGLCNESYTTLETALFPEDFEEWGRKTRNYRQKTHKCPFDLRPKGSDYAWGCFHDCFIFGNGEYFKKLDITKGSVEEIRALVNKTIKEAK